MCQPGTISDADAMTLLLKRRRPPIVLSGLLAIALVASACGADEADTAGPAADQPGHTDAGSGHGNETFDFGEPADAADADRVIEVEAADNLRFVPDAIDVTVGETVTFRITNTGKLPHDFTLGDSATQDAHDAEMAGMDMGDMGPDDTNAVSLPAGVTKELTWTFAEADTILMGCHVPGHYAAGMVGDINITDPS